MLNIYDKDLFTDELEFSDSYTITDYDSMYVIYNDLIEQITEKFEFQDHKNFLNDTQIRDVVIQDSISRLIMNSEENIMIFNNRRELSDQLYDDILEEVYEEKTLNANYTVVHDYINELLGKDLISKRFFRTIDGKLHVNKIIYNLIKKFFQPQYNENVKSLNILFDKRIKNLEMYYYALEEIVNLIIEDERNAIVYYFVFLSNIPIDIIIIILRHFKYLNGAKEIEDAISNKFLFSLLDFPLIDTRESLINTILDQYNDLSKIKKKIYGIESDIKKIYNHAIGEINIGKEFEKEGIKLFGKNNLLAEEKSLLIRKSQNCEEMYDKTNEFMLIIYPILVESLTKILKNHETVLSNELFSVENFKLATKIKNIKNLFDDLNIQLINDNTKDKKYSKAIVKILNQHKRLKEVEYKFNRLNLVILEEKEISRFDINNQKIISTKCHYGSDDIVKNLKKSRREALEYCNLL